MLTIKVVAAAAAAVALRCGVAVSRALHHRNLNNAVAYFEHSPRAPVMNISLNILNFQHDFGVLLVFHSISRDFFAKVCF